MMQSTDTRKAIDAAVGAIEKQFGKGAIMRLGEKNPLTERLEVIPTGALSLDIALGIGGLPRGRIIEIFGPESSGKTTLCLSVIAEIQRQGGNAVFVDVEHALDPRYAKVVGVDLDAGTTGASCVGGSCKCPGTMTACNGACTDTRVDRDNCGGCGISCGTGTCSSGTCTCAPGRQFCPGVGCVDTTNDPKHCGSCTNACATGKVCVSSACAMTSDYRSGRKGASKGRNSGENSGKLRGWYSFRLCPGGSS